jgi:hypothetical protein
MKRWLGSYSLTPAGGAMLFLLIAAVAVLLLGPKHEEAPAFVVIAVVLAMFVMGSSPGGIRQRGRRQRTLSDYRSQFHLRERNPRDEPEAPVDEALWRRERERREQKRQD